MNSVLNTTNIVAITRKTDKARFSSDLLDQRKYMHEKYDRLMDFTSITGIPRKNYRKNNIQQNLVFTRSARDLIKFTLTK